MKEVEILPIKNEKDLELRMYNLTIYNISSIQCGIQSYHAGIEYARKYGNDESFKLWADKWKTLIIKNGGTTNNGELGVYGYEAMKGSLNNYYDQIIEQGIKAVPFYEPDLNNAMTSIAFIVDERVFNKKLYPDFNTYINNKYDVIEAPKEGESRDWKVRFSDDYIFWMSIIGEKNIWLRENIQPLSLASN